MTADEFADAIAAHLVEHTGAPFVRDFPLDDQTFAIAWPARRVVIDVAPLLARVDPVRYGPARGWHVLIVTGPMDAAKVAAVGDTLIWELGIRLGRQLP